MVLLECPKCGTISERVIGSILAKFKAVAIGVNYPDHIEIGTATRAIATEPLISLVLLQCEKCNEWAPPEEWKFQVTCSCGQLVAKLETMQDKILEMTYCRKYKQYLCRECWTTMSCNRCKYTCRLEEFYKGD